MTPTISRGRESMVSVRPMTVRSPPNFRCQYPYPSITVSGPPSSKSRAANHRPSIGRTANVSKIPGLTLVDRTCSGCPSPVTVLANIDQMPTDSNERFCSL